MSLNQLNNLIEFLKKMGLKGDITFIQLYSFLNKN